MDLWTPVGRSQCFPKPAEDFFSSVRTVTEVLIDITTNKFLDEMVYHTREELTPRNIEVSMTLSMTVSLFIRFSPSNFRRQMPLTAKSRQLTDKNKHSYSLTEDEHKIDFGEVLHLDTDHLL